MPAASPLRASEIVGIGYLAYLALASLIVRLPPGRRTRIWAFAALVVAANVAIARRPITPLGLGLRDWLPGPVIIVAYFATGAFYHAPSARVEAWLRGWDDALIGRGRFAGVPQAVRVYLELVYDFCFLLAPAGFATLVAIGRSASADRFWTLVSIAEYIPFGTLPWLQARPPWAIEARVAQDRAAVRRFSLAWVQRTTIGANTFPSGHASGSLAVALAMAHDAPRAAAVAAFVAVSIACASVVGRFHYAIDAITGLLLALAIWYLATLLGY